MIAALLRAALALEGVVHAGDDVVACDGLPGHLGAELSAGGDQAFEILRGAREAAL